MKSRRRCLAHRITRRSWSTPSGSSRKMQGLLWGRTWISPSMTPFVGYLSDLVVRCAYDHSHFPRIGRLCGQDGHSLCDQRRKLHQSECGYHQKNYFQGQCSKWFPYGRPGGRDTLAEQNRLQRKTIIASCLMRQLFLFGLTHFIFLSLQGVVCPLPMKGWFMLEWYKYM